MASMASSKFFTSFFFILVLCLKVTAKNTYIVHMKHQEKPLPFETHHDWYSSSLQSLSDSPSDSLLYSYTAAFNGFAASLDEEQAESLGRSDSVLGVYEDTVYTLHTTRTPRFLGIDSEMGRWAGPNTQQLEQASRDVIIGVLDTGVWPESKSFDDAGMPKIPSNWRGECELASDFGPKFCNRKLIGARSFSKGYHMATGSGGIFKRTKQIESPRDRDGHGTHTASTAAGSHVANASLLGYARGIARGMATHARVATYKVCWETGCFGSDILAGMDRAIQDGVDILSMSLGGGSGPYYRDSIALGAFVAVQRGIFVSCSAGNSGPVKATLANVAPWIMTVGAGTLDRDFPAYAVLGNKIGYNGVSLYNGRGMGKKSVRLVYNKDNSSSNLCLPGSLDPASVRGKIVVLR
ncbi:subtilisin-like protease SBT1.8 [Hibiscus syriacus]|uniref:subtilisin-like protease SBT1.8 n=1 Tax=Hibiscus syriacus TaxID=106335 RepID=UPI0019222051|nr:subtilisin-like protease SBT1.8 [Hibiscus syriacus]